MSENKSCPFCGNEKIEALHMGHGGVSAYCYECEAEGPPRSTEAEAMEAWNRRAPESQAQRVPLSEEQRRAIFDDLWPHGADAGIRKLFTATVFATEAAHSITQEKQG